MHHHQKLTAFAVALTFTGLPASALAEAELSPTVVTATRTQTRVNEVLSDVTVITHEQIERLGQTTVVELLQVIPSVQITSAGGRGSSSALYIRGANANHTLVLIDGQRVSSATTGTTALEHMPAELVERIEVLRGPASSLYGADAIGGVIQIFTRKGSGAPKPELSLGYGSYNTSVGSFRYGGQIENTRFSIQAGWDQSDSISSVRGQAISKSTGLPSYSLFDKYNSDNDAYRNTNLSAQVSRKIRDGLEVGGNFLYSEGLKHFDTSNCDPTYKVCTTNFDNQMSQTLQSLSTYLSYKPSGNWTSVLRMGQSTDDNKNPQFNPLANVVTNQRYKTTQNQLSWQNDIRTGAGVFMAAMEWRNERVMSTQPFDANSRTTRSLVAGYQGWFGAHSAQASARMDDISGMGSHQTGSLAYGYEIRPGWHMRAGAGTGFHAPTFDDLYWPLDPANNWKGNPNLKPEYSYNKEVGLTFENQGTRAGVTVFHNRIKDLLDVAPGAAPDYIGYMDNLASAVLKGMNVNAVHDFGGWKLSGNADILNARDGQTGRRLQRRAPKTAIIELRRKFSEIDAGIQFQTISARYDDKANLMRLGGYALINLDVRYPLARGWSVLAKANNVLDRRYESQRFDNYDGTYNRIGTPGANVFVGVRYAPK